MKGKKLIKKILNQCLIVLLFYQLMSCKNHERKAYNNLKNSNDLELYKSYLSEYPDSKNFKTVLSEYYKAFEKAGYCWVEPGTRNCEINVLPDSLPCIDGTLLSSKDFYVNYQTFFSKNWEGRWGVSTSFKTCKIENIQELKSFSAGGFRICCDSEEAFDRVQQLAIVCKKLLDNYSNELGLEWFQKPYNKVSKTNREVIDSVMNFYNRIQFANYANSNHCTFAPPPPPPPEKFIDVLNLIDDEYELDE